MEKNCRSFRNFYRLHSDAAAAQMLIVHFVCREKDSNVSRGGKKKKVVVSTRQKEEEEKKNTPLWHAVSAARQPSVKQDMKWRCFFCGGQINMD